MPVGNDNNANARAKSLRWLIASIPILIAFGFLVRLPLVWKDQAILSGLIVLCSVIVGRLSTSRFTTLALTFLSIFCTLRYGIWRWTSSITYLNHSGWHVEPVGMVFAFLLLLAETYAVVILLLGFFQGARPLLRKPAPMPDDTDLWPAIDVFIPTYNEPLEVVRPTVLAALGIDWPADRLNVYLLDDGRRRSFQEFAAEAGVGYLTRFDNAHAKAGNINAAVKVTKGEYIAIFDCDHIATRSFLQVTMGWFFRDSRLAMVQTPHHFYSPDPFERNLNVFRKVPNEGALFYGVVQDGNDLWNATFFCGSCAVIKRAALEEIGGIAVETVTEDAHTALRLQRLGWNTAYIGIPQAAGLATGSLSAHVGQRIRWARGMVQILRTECPLFVSGLKLPQRLCYFNCVIHYLYAIPRLIFVSAPLVYLIFGASNLYGYIWEIVAYAAPHLVLSNIVNARTQGDHRHSFWNEVYEMVLAPYILLPTTFALINPKWGKFNVTAKSSVVEESFFDWKIARPYLALLALNVIGIAMAIPRYLAAGESSGVLLVNVAWAMVNTLMLGACISVALESKQRRSNARIEAPMTASLMLASGESHHCKVIDLSEGGLALRSDRILEVASGDEAIAVVRAGDEEYRLHVETVRTSQNCLHMKFLGDSLKHQHDITKLVYARADSWLDWTKDQKRNNIIGSLVNVFGIGAHGLWILPSLLIKREAKAAPKPEEKAVAKKAVILPAILLLLFSAHAVRLNAQTKAVPQPPAAADGSSLAFQNHQSLSELGQDRPITLKGMDDRSSIPFVVPSTKIVDAAALSLRYSAERIPQDDKTVLEVTLNDLIVTSIALSRAASTPQPIQITLPSDLLVHDNALTFHLRRDCPKPCKETSGDGQWVRIDATSELDTSGTVLPLPNRLSMLPSPFFDPSIHRSMELPFVFSASPDRATLKAAGILGSWYGAMASYRGAHFKTSINGFPAGNAIVLAPSDSELASRLGLARVDSTIAICDNPSDPYGKILALISPNTQDLVKLAQAVASNALHIDADRISLNQIVLSENNLSGPPSTWAVSNAPLKIAEHLNEDLLRVGNRTPANIYFSISPDLDFGTNATVPLRLDYHLSGLSPDDRVILSLQLNGVQVAERTLKGRDAAQVQEQTFPIPVVFLYSSNTLAVELRAASSDALASDLAATKLQILPSTRLGIQNADHYVRLPRLDLFAASGFPFTQHIDLSGTSVALPAAPTSAQIGLYLDTLAFISAHTGYPATKFELSDSLSAARDANRDLIVIGSGKDGDLFEPFEGSMLLRPAGGTFLGGKLGLGWSDWLNRSWVDRSAEKQRLFSVMNRDLPPGFLLEEFEHPLHNRKSVLVVATRSEMDENPYFSKLSEEARKGHVRGGIALGNANEFESFDLAPGFYTLGNDLSRVAMYSWARFHLFLIPLLLTLGAFVVARWWDIYLERQAARRLSVGT